MPILSIGCTCQFFPHFIFVHCSNRVDRTYIWKDASLAYYGVDNCLKQCQANVMFGRKCSVRIGAAMFMLHKVVLREL